MSEIVRVTTSDKMVEDLASRVAQFKPTETEVGIPDGTTFDINEIEKIADPKQKEMATKMYKSFQKGYNEKYQNIASLAKTLEGKLGESDQWTPERVQGLLDNKDFVQAAQSVAGVTNSSSDFSTLSEDEKKQLATIQDQVRLVSAQNANLLKAQQDADLSKTYANYNPETMDVITNDILKGKRRVTRTDIWKSYDYNEAIERAYALGKQDKKLETDENISQMSIEGITTQADEGIPKKEENESNDNFFKRLVIRRLTQRK